MNLFTTHVFARAGECAQLSTDLDFMWRQGNLKEGFLVWQLLRGHSDLPDPAANEIESQNLYCLGLCESVLGKQCYIFQRRVIDVRTYTI